MRRDAIPAVLVCVTLSIEAVVLAYLQRLGFALGAVASIAVLGLALIVLDYHAVRRGP